MTANDAPAPIRAGGTPGTGAAAGVPEGADAPEQWLGVTLVHRGADLGVVGHVTRGDAPCDCILHAFGGVSGSLEYRVPATAIERVLGVSGRAVVDRGLEFQPSRLCVDGTVILGPHDPGATARPAASIWNGDPSGLAGMHVYADDGYLGTVEAAQGHPLGDASAAFVIVLVRPWLRRSRRLRIPARCVLAANRHAGLLRLTGRRRDLRAFADAPTAG